MHTEREITEPYDESIEPPTPIIYKENLDVTNRANMKNIILIDSRVTEKELFYNNTNSNTFPIIYYYNSDQEELLTLLRLYFVEGIRRISFVFHDGGTDFRIPFMNNKLLFHPDDLLATSSSGLSENVSLLINIITEFKTSNVDFLACNTLKYANWNKYYDLIEKNTSAIVGASNNDTGNLLYGGDWLMENTNENVKIIYFSENIDNYASTLAPTTISQNGGTIYLRMNSSQVEYSSSSTGPWTPVTSADWNLIIENTNPVSGNVLTILFTEDLTISNTYGNTSGYIFIGSDYVTIDGQGYNININNIDHYLGLIHNGSNVTATDGYNNVVVQNINTNVIGGSLSTATNARAGWICASSFGRGAAENYITNCSNNGGIGDFCGGVCGERVAGGGISVIITGCTNTGNITGVQSGGIVGYYAGTSGTIVITDCTNIANITGAGSGGVCGAFAGYSASGSATFNNCSNIGNISGGLAGGICGQSGGFVTFVNCSNTGNISVGGQSGGISGAFVGLSADAFFTSCSNTGNITSSYAGGICGVQAGQNGTVTVTNCTNTGYINGVESGGIAGSSSGVGGLATFTNCSNTGEIIGVYTGGISGSNSGQGGYVIFNNCSNTGDISGDYAGGIAGVTSGFQGGDATFTDCTNTGDISGDYAGGISGAQAGRQGVITVTSCYSIGIINGAQSGGIVGASIGWNSSQLFDIINCYSLGAISTTAGGICGGQYGTYTTTPTVNITNCYSYGAYVDSGSGIVALGLTITPIQTNCYVANGTWTDNDAKLNLTGFPASIDTNNPGVTWTSVSTDTPYVLSGYNAEVYSPNSTVTSITNINQILDPTPGPGLFQSGYTYNLLYLTKTTNVLTLNVFVAKAKGSAPYYYGYNFNTFTITNTNTKYYSMSDATIASIDGIITIISDIVPTVLDKILAGDLSLTVYPNNPIQNTIIDFYSI